MLTTVLLLVLVTFATVTDLRYRKIYNWTTYPGILAALVASGIGSWLPVPSGEAEERFKWWLGVPPIDESLLGLALCGGVMLVCFTITIFKIGGGDVKLMAMLGAFLGWQEGLAALLWTCVFGACMALIILVWRVGPVALVAKVFRHLMWKLRLGDWGPLTEEERALLQERLHFAPGALVAVVIVKLGFGP